jgi:nucleotide-binding universal stress UspA family protein
VRRPLTAHLVVPVANEEDSRATARCLREFDPGEVTVVHVVEKAGRAPDKLSPEQAAGLAEELFTVFREIIPDVETELVYDEDVVEGITDLAVTVNASAIAFRPRGANRLIRLLAGDKARRLVRKTDLPVIALTDTGAEGS